MAREILSDKTRGVCPGSPDWSLVYSLSVPSSASNFCPARDRRRRCRYRSDCSVFMSLRLGSRRMGSTSERAPLYLRQPPAPLANRYRRHEEAFG